MTKWDDKSMPSEEFSYKMPLIRLKKKSCERKIKITNSDLRPFFAADFDNFCTNVFFYIFGSYFLSYCTKYEIIYCIVYDSCEITKK